MVTRNIKVVESDLSGEPGAEPTLIGLKGEVMALDLTLAERVALEEVFAPYIARARRLGPLTPNVPSPRRVPESTSEERVAIRAWARADGYEVARFGQIPNKVVKTYREAQRQAAG